VRCRAVCGDGDGREVDEGVIATIKFIIVVALVHPPS
jgi:hypothetical protein